MVGVLGQAGMEMDVEMQSMFEKMLPTKRETRRLTVARCPEAALRPGSRKTDRSSDKIHRTAIERVEQSGIVFIDEIDKVAGTEEQARPGCQPAGRAARSAADRRGEHGHDQVWAGEDRSHSVHRRRRVSQQQAERSDAGVAGAISHPRGVAGSDQGRFRADSARAAECADQAADRAARRPKALHVEFTDDAIDAMAQIAFDVNRRSQNIGARRLYTILEKVFETISFECAGPGRRSR